MVRTFGFVVRSLLFGLVTLFWSIAAVLVVPLSSDVVMRCFAPRWAKHILWVSGVRMKIVGNTNNLKAPAYLVMSNHTSYFDIPAALAGVPLVLRPIAKRELVWFPVFGWALWMGVAILVDRGDRAKAIESMERAARQIQRGRSVLLYPEGTRSSDGSLGPLKRGPFHLAAASSVPVLPIAIRGSGAIQKKGDWRIHPGTLELHIGDPLETSAYPNTEEGRDALRRDVESALIRLGNVRASPASSGSS